MKFDAEFIEGAVRRCMRLVGRSRRSLAILGSTRARSATGSLVTRSYGPGGTASPGMILPSCSGCGLRTPSCGWSAMCSSVPWSSAVKEPVRRALHRIAKNHDASSRYARNPAHPRCRPSPQVTGPRRTSRGRTTAAARTHGRPRPTVTYRDGRRPSAYTSHSMTPAATVRAHTPRSYEQVGPRRPSSWHDRTPAAARTDLGIEPDRRTTYLAPCEIVGRLPDTIAELANRGRSRRALGATEADSCGEAPRLAPLRVGGSSAVGRLHGA